VICGVMIESHIVGGRQEFVSRETTIYNQNITDACLGWDDTVPVLEGLARAVEARRRA
jgi:3-deoxy-7-phosphoheptulonate synthase